MGVGIAIPPERPVAGGITDGVANRPAPPPVVRPTHTFDTERVRLEIAGVELELVAAPGETADQLYVWLPEQRVVFAGDNFYQSWPNVYPLRGTAQRSFRDRVPAIRQLERFNRLNIVIRVLAALPSDQEFRVRRDRDVELTGQSIFKWKVMRYACGLLWRINGVDEI